MANLDYALLIGSGLAFIAVAATMYVTRKVDGYGGADSRV
jgi:inner membrane protein involved in colicin E2 resistance